MKEKEWKVVQEEGNHTEMDCSTLQSPGWGMKCLLWGLLLAGIVPMTSQERDGSPGKAKSQVVKPVSFFPCWYYYVLMIPVGAEVKAGQSLRCLERKARDLKKVTEEML